MLLSGEDKEQTWGKLPKKHIYLWTDEQVQNSAITEELQWKEIIKR